MRHPAVLSIAVLALAQTVLAQDNLGTPPPAEVAPTAQPTVTRTESGKSLVVAAEHKDLGTIYYDAPTAAKQVSFTSIALNAKFNGHSRGVVGYAVAGPADNPAALKAGLWALPVKSLDSGNSLKNKHTVGPEWLEAAKYPDIVFALKEVREIRPHKETPGGKSYTGTLVGDLTMHGVTRTISIPDAVLGFARASDKAPVRGELLAIRCKYAVKLSDYGISNKYTTELKSVADEIQLDQSLILSTVPPEQQPEVKIEPESEGDVKPESK